MRDPARIAEYELISQCKIGNLKHQEILYKRFYGFAMGVGMRYSLNRDDAMEAVNDAFIKIFNNIQHFDPRRSFKPWLATIVINTALDKRRQQLKHESTIEISHALSVASDTDTIENLTAKDILKLLSRLPAIQATIFNLYEIDGYNHDDIAKMLEIPASSSRVYLMRAKEKLRNMLLMITDDERRSV